MAIVAPASPFKTDELIESLDIIKEVGLVPVLGPNVKQLRTFNVHAASVEDRVDELMWAFDDDSISGIIVATGGNGSGAILPYLDYELIAAAAKPLLGMSDITALNNGILARSDLITFNGQSPNIRLNEGRKIHDSDSESFRITLQLLMSGEAWDERPFAMNQYIPRVVSPGRARGRVVGGNCDTFVHLLGTEYFPDVKGGILFIEDVHKDGSALSRQFLHLKLAGVLDKVAGVVIGEFVDFMKSLDRDHPSPAVEDVIQEYFSDGPPCVYGYSFSHGPMTIPIPIGSDCVMDADTGMVSFNFAMDNAS